MRSIRVIPCLDIKDGRVVKGTNFVDLKDSGDPVELGRFYAEQGADELVFLDITASSDERPPVIELAERVARTIFIPFTIGGGIRSVAMIREALLAGADKISVNTAAIQSPELIEKGADRFGSQCIVVAIDAKWNPELKTWKVFTHGGRNETNLEAIRWAEQVAKLGAGEILLTSMDGDGTRQGYDLPLTKAISEAVGIPVIASGGVGSGQDMIDGVNIGRADAVLLAGILHEGLATIQELKAEMATAGIPVRI